MTSTKMTGDEKQPHGIAATHLDLPPPDITIDFTQVVPTITPQSFGPVSPGRTVTILVIAPPGYPLIGFAPLPQLSSVRRFDNRRDDGVTDTTISLTVSVSENYVVSLFTLPPTAESKTATGTIEVSGGNNGEGGD